MKMGKKIQGCNLLIFSYRDKTCLLALSTVTQEKAPVDFSCTKKNEKEKEEKKIFKIKVDEKKEKKKQFNSRVNNKKYNMQNGTRDRRKDISESEWSD